MNSKRISFVWLALLVLVSGLVTFSVVPAAYAEPSFDQGCYCHNNGIGVWFNGTGFNEFAGVTVAGGGKFVLNATSENLAATGVVPGVQQWLSNMSDNAKFTFNPTSVSDTSTQNLKHQKGNITAFYTITAPSTGGNYLLTFYAEGTMVGFAVQVNGPTSSSSSSSSSSSTATSSSASQSTSSTSQSASSTSSASVVTSPTSSSSSSQSVSTTSTSQTSTKASPAAPSVFYYSSELGVIVLGFSLFVVVAIWRYRKS